jgi:hypothetical protein
MKAASLFYLPACGTATAMATRKSLHGARNWKRSGGCFAALLPEIDPICRDPNDDHVIATALAVNADVIVTGDKDLLELSQYQSIRILTARAFLTELGGRDAC